MQQLDLVIHNEAGLHARPAKTLVNLAKTFSSDIKIQHGPKKVNAKSMISVLTLGVKRSGQILFEISGDDEVAASEAILEAVNSGLGEPLPAQAVNGGAGKSAQPVPAPSKAKTEANLKNADGTLSGIGASAGIVSGPIVQLHESDDALPTGFDGVDAERAKLDRAMAGAKQELEDLIKKLTAELSASESEIFEAHLEILSDPDLKQAVAERIQNGANGAVGWKAECEARADALSQLADENLAARAADIRDVSGRVLAVMLNKSSQKLTLSQPSILVARDLAPSDTAVLDRDMVLGFLTAEGGPNAHSAIIARAMGIPAIVGLGKPVQQMADGTIVIMDGQSGTIEVAPTAERLAQATAEQAAKAEQSRIALEKAHDPAVTLDGHQIEVMVNAGSAEETAVGKEKGAEGVGLLRTEFLFLGRETAPDEATQIAVYTKILQAMGEHPVIFRTLDIGGDKPVPYIQVPNEENPFLGERGLRLMLSYPDLLRTQLRALLLAHKAVVDSKMKIMFPMVGQLFEWQKARKAFDEVAAELGQSTENIELGIMIEVPSAALNAAAFADEVDFFSVGTNDLTQYTLAIDRQHPTLAGQADGLDPSVLSLINLTVKAAHKAGKWVGVCGELAADADATAILIGLGVDELSVNSNALPLLKARIRSLSKPDAVTMAQKALQAKSAADVRQLSK